MIITNRPAKLKHSLPTSCLLCSSRSCWTSSSGWEVGASLMVNMDSLVVTSPVSLLFFLKWHNSDWWLAMSSITFDRSFDKWGWWVVQCTILRWYFPQVWICVLIDFEIILCVIVCFLQSSFHGVAKGCISHNCGMCTDIRGLCYAGALDRSESRLGWMYQWELEN